jgi:hypothetical protein
VRESSRTIPRGVDGWVLASFLQGVKGRIELKFAHSEMRQKGEDYKRPSRQRAIFVSLSAGAKSEGGLEVGDGWRV